jgi:hypothetical protein
MKIVQNVLGFLTIVIIFLMLMTVQKSEGAVIVEDITASGFNTLTTTHQAAWSVVFRGGGNSGFGSEEIQVARNTATPQLGGGGNTYIGNLSSGWSLPITNIWVQIDALSYLSAGAGSTTVDNTPDYIPIIAPFNQILVLVADMDIFGSTSEIQSNLINGQSFSNLLADGNGTYDYRVVSITGVGQQFGYTGVWAPGLSPGSDAQYVQFVGIYNTTIPEPSAMSFFLLAPALLCLRKR